VFRRILHFLFGNLLFKIFAIVLALSIWVLAVLLRPQTANFVVPIEFAHLPNDLVITKFNTNKINVAFHGRGSDFIKLLFHKPIYQLNLAMAKPGPNRIKFAPDELVIAAPVLLKSITPEYSELTIEELEREKVAVNVPHRIEVQKGTYIVNVAVQDTVTLSGPASEMQFIKQVTTESLFVSDFSKPQFSRKLKVNVPDTTYFQAVPESVNVIASLEKETTKIFSDIKVNIAVSAQKEAVVNPKTAQITVRGAISLIQSLQASDITLKINTLQLQPSEYKMPAEIILPKNTFLVRCDPQLFEVKIR
jgi:hypothetical protein